MSNFEGNIRRLAMDPEFNAGADTETECEYLNHSSTLWATVIVDVDVSDCCRVEYNEHMRVCWRCAVYGLNDEFYCLCQGEGSQKSKEQLTFKGVIEEVEKPEKKKENA